jgi:chaperonin GroES
VTRIVKPGQHAPVPVIRAPQEGVYGDIKVPNIRIVGPRLLVLPAQAVEYQTGTGIVIPEKAQDHSAKGVVLLLGDGVMLENGTRLKSNVEVGDEIVYARYAGVELEMEGEKYLIIQESDVRCVLTYRGKAFKMLGEDAGDATVAASSA